MGEQHGEEDEGAEAPLVCGHDAESCCPDCTRFTDGLGFPHASEAHGRRRVQQCRVCRRFVEREEWVNDIRRLHFGCKRCAPKA